MPSLVLDALDQRCVFVQDTKAVDLPLWVDAPPVGWVTPLSRYAFEYDYIADQGHKNIGSWIDRAAKCPRSSPLALAIRRDGVAAVGLRRA